MTVVKTKIGSAFFNYIEHYDSEEDALNSKNGEFKKVIIVGNLKMERTIISKQEEHDGQKHQNRTPKVEGSWSKIISTLLG